MAFKVGFVSHNEKLRITLALCFDERKWGNKEREGNEEMKFPTFLHLDSKDKGKEIGWKNLFTICKKPIYSTIEIFERKTDLFSLLSLLFYKAYLNTI